MKLIHTDLLKTGTLTTLGSLAGYDISNLLDIRLSRPWRTDDIASTWFKVDLGSAKDVDAIALIAHNLTSGATIHLQGNATDAWGAPSVDEVVTWRSGVIYLFLNSAETYQWWRVTIADAGNSDGYLEIGRAMLCEHFDLPEFPSTDFKDAPEDETQRSFSVTGQLYANVGIKYRKYSIGLGVVADATRQAFVAVVNSVRIYDPIVLFIDENATSKVEPLYCIFDKLIAFSHAGGWGWRDDGLEFREVF